MRSSFQHHFAPCLSLLRRAGLFSHRTPSLLGVLMGCHWLLPLQDLPPVGWVPSYQVSTLLLSCGRLSAFLNAEDIFFLHCPSFHVLSKPFLLSVSYWLTLGQEGTLALLVLLWNSCYCRHWNGIWHLFCWSTLFAVSWVWICLCFLLNSGDIYMKRLYIHFLVIVYSF